MAILDGYDQIWPKLDLQNLSLVSFVLFTAIRALSSQAVAAVVRLPNLPSLTCPYKAYKVTTTSFTALSTPPTAASATVLHHKFATQRSRLTVYTRGRRPLCGWRYCHQMGALCTVHCPAWCFMGEDTAIQCVHSVQCTVGRMVPAVWKVGKWLCRQCTAGALWEKILRSLSPTFAFDSVSSAPSMLLLYFSVSVLLSKILCLNTYSDLWVKARGVPSYDRYVPWLPSHQH